MGINSHFELAQQGEKVYQMYCVGCNGTNLKGTSAEASLLTENLKQGIGKASISQVIGKGCQIII